MLFQTDGSFSPGPLAKFLDMPQTPLFTLNLNTPESWMVESIHTRYDLDNIYLEEVCFLFCFRIVLFITRLPWLMLSFTSSAGECGDCGLSILVFV